MNLPYRRVVVLLGFLLGAIGLPIPSGAAALSPGAVHTQVIAGHDPAIEQQIDIQDINLTTTSQTYTDASGSGSFAWNANRYSGLQHVYLEAGISKQNAPSTTQRIRSGDILSNLISGTDYKVRIEYGCTYNSSTNVFTETGSAELWSSDSTIEVTPSAVTGTINTGTGICPTTPTTASIRFSRLIILQSDPNILTDTDTYINIGHNEQITPVNTSDYPLKSPKIWMYTDHALHPSAGWDSIKDVLFSATVSSPRAVPVSACLYDITSSTEITCVTTSSTSPTYLASGDVSLQLHDGDQYETYVKAGVGTNPVSIYNAFVNVEQSSTSGLAYFEIYDDFNPYPVSSATQNAYSPRYFLNLWEPSNYNLNDTLTVPSSDEMLAFHFESTESTNSASPSSVSLENSCYGTKCTPGQIFAANVDTTNTNATRVRTVDNAFPMPDAELLDAGLEVKGTSGIATSNVSWLIINITVIPTYGVQVTQNIAYGPEPYELLDQCTPVNAPPNRPGIVIIHGGLWAGSDKEDTQYPTLCSDYAAEGYVVENIDYRLTSPKWGSWEWPSQIGDVQLAVRYMRSVAAQTNLDPSRICAYGWSAGSQLGLLVDEMQTIFPADVSSQLSSYSPATECVVDFFGPTDMTLLYNEDPTLDTKYIVPYMDNQTPTSDPSIYVDASPVQYVSSSSGPAIVIQGTQDLEVPPAQAQELLAAMQSSGVPYNLLQYVGAHAFQGYPQYKVNMIREQVDAWLIAQEHP